MTKSAKHLALVAAVRAGLWVITARFITSAGSRKKRSTCVSVRFFMGSVLLSESGPLPDRGVSGPFPAAAATPTL